MGYCEKVKNITVSLDDETYRRARVRAAEQATSVSGVVRRLLVEYASTETESDRLKREEQILRESIKSFTAGDRLPRDDLYRR